MRPELLPLVVFLTYLGLLLLLGLVSNFFFRGTAADYFLASRGIGSFLLLMSLFGTTMTAFALVGSTGESFKEGIGVYGLMASWSGIIHPACFFLIGIKLWAFGKRFGYTTQIQFFRDRFESDNLGLLLFPILVGLVMPYLLIGVMSAGASIEKMTAGALPALFAGGQGPGAAAAGALPYWLGSALVCVVVLIYVFFGGVRGTTWVNAFQTLIFLSLGLATLWTFSKRMGGFRQATEMVRQYNPDKLRREVRPDDPLTRYKGDFAVYEKKKAEQEARPASATAPRLQAPEPPHGISKLLFLTYGFVPLSVGMFPHLFQHWLTARSARSFRLTLFMHPIMIMIVWLPCVMLGTWATSAMINGQPVIPYGTPEKLVLVTMVRGLAGDVLGPLLAAGIPAAIMASLDSQFLCLGSMFTHDIVDHYIKHDRLGDRAKVISGRIFIVVIVALTWLWAQAQPGSVFDLGVWCFSGFAALFPLIFAALYWKRATRAGAYACVLAAAGTWLYFFIRADFGAGSSGHEDTLPVVIMISASTAALIIVSLLTRPPSRATIDKFFSP